MFVEFKSSIAGTNHEFHHGDIVEWPDDAEGRAECECMEKRGMLDILTEAGARLKADLGVKRIKKFVRPRPEPTPTPAQSRPSARKTM